MPLVVDFVKTAISAEGQKYIDDCIAQVKGKLQAEKNCIDSMCSSVPEPKGLRQLESDMKNAKRIPLYVGAGLLGGGAALYLGHKAYTNSKRKKKS